MDVVLFSGEVDEHMLIVLRALRAEDRSVLLISPGPTALRGWAAPHSIAVLDLREPDWTHVAVDLSQHQVRWIGWNRDDLPGIGLQAYQAGAVAVYPSHLPPEMLIAGLARLADRARPASRASTERTYRRGSLILPEDDSVVEIRAGVLAQSVTHADGARVLLGLYGPGQLVISHPHDNCSLQLEASTDVVVLVKSWEQAVRQPDFAVRLRDRLQQLEAWASMQARPHLDQRLLGLLTLLAEAFGKPHPEGTLIDLRLTQTQLASAANATRSTVTRAIGQLRQRGLLTTVGRGEQERYCLARLEPHHHHLAPTANEDEPDRPFLEN